MRTSERAEQLCEELKTVAERVGLSVREEALLREVGYHARSGSCRVKGDEILFIDRSLSVAERIEVLLDELGGRDIRSVYVSPAVRRLLERRAATDAGLDEGHEGVGLSDELDRGP